MSRMPAKIVTLAQLALLPRETLVASLRLTDKGMVQFDSQGIVDVGPLHRILGCDATWIHLSPVLPDVRIVDGRVESSWQPTSICLDNEFPHRFVVYPPLPASIRRCVRRPT